MTTIKEMWARLQEQLEHQAKVQKTVKELSKLSNKELQDIGLNRCDIYRVAEGKH
jgi:uncharacterized protein YjiS (DUF1127 family)